MAVFETFSKRQAKLRGDVIDTYIYDKLPDSFRNQLYMIMTESIGEWYTGAGNQNHYARAAYKSIVATMRKETGKMVLYQQRGGASEHWLNELLGYITQAPAVGVIDLIEVYCVKATELFNEATNTDTRRRLSGGIVELNYRLKEHGIGYEFTDGELIRIDSEFVHAQAVKPALALLRDKRFAGAQDEFLSAYEHYRSGKTKEALTDSLKAIESTMKVICDKRGWTFAEGDSSKKLIDICLQNGLIPPYWQSHFTSLRSMLESSVPTARNKNGAHGQGLEIQTVPDHLASYVLHMTASTIVFLVKAEQALP